MMLEDYVRDNFDGMVTVADIHGDFESISKAYAYAKGENYFFLSLGDLVDRGSHPYEVVELMYHAIYDGRAGLIVGNHDDKFIRYADGAQIKFSADGRGTLWSVGDDRMAEFLRMYKFMSTEPLLTGYYQKFDEMVFVHAASHSALWGSDFKLDAKVKARFLVGETNNEYYEDGYPKRLYNWVDKIPMGRTVIVGHDMQPIHNIRIIEPLVKTNVNGGKVIFLDTGCGKGGFLTGAVFANEKKKFKFVEFKEFK